MNFEIAAQAGSKPALKAPDVQEVVTLLYRLGDHSEAIETADRAWELGAEYLREATLGDVQMGDQASRWQAFCQLNGGDVRHDTVLHDLDTGSRYVRTQWLMEYLRVRSDVGERPGCAPSSSGSAGSGRVPRVASRRPTRASRGRSSGRS